MEEVELKPENAPEAQAEPDAPKTVEQAPAAEPVEVSAPECAEQAPIVPGQTEQPTEAETSEAAAEPASEAADQAVETSGLETGDAVAGESEQVLTDQASGPPPAEVAEPAQAPAVAETAEEPAAGQQETSEVEQAESAAAEPSEPPAEGSTEAALPESAATEPTAEPSHAEAAEEPAAEQQEPGEAAEAERAAAEPSEPPAEGSSEVAAPEAATAEPAVQSTETCQAEAAEKPADEQQETGEAAAPEAAAEQMVLETQPISDEDDNGLRAAIEAIIYVTEEPASAAQIAAALQRPEESVTQVLNELVAEYARSPHGIMIREVAGGFKMTTKPEHHETIRVFVKSLKPPLKLSLAALETLATIAYKQPITAPEIMEIRGVQGAGVLKTLLDRKLIQTAGRKNVVGRPILYKTTKEFLVQFGLKDLAELPTLKEFEELRRLSVSESEAETPEAEAPAPQAQEAQDSAPEAQAAEASAGEAVPAETPAPEPAADPAEPDAEQARQPASEGENA